MSSPYVGEIRMFAGNFAPVGWALCQGQIVPITENETLFNLIGTTYGGDGQSTFALPNLASRVPIHMGSALGQTFVIGQTAGVEAVTLTTSQIPGHSHTLLATSNIASTNAPAGNVPAATAAATVTPYGTDAPIINVAPQSIGSAGGSQPHDNMPPFLCINFIISLFGVFPTPN